MDKTSGNKTQLDVVVRQLADNCEPLQKEFFLQEAVVLQHLKHPHIVHIHGVVTGFAFYINKREKQLREQKKII